ncbi:MAG: ATP-binding protein [Planctomycetota bacterium]
MAFSLDSISTGKAHRAPRIVLLGVEKVGKSTFAAGSESPIFLPIKGEEGIDALDVAKFPTAGSFSDVIDMLGTLYADDHEYKTVVIDSASALEPLIWSHACQKDNVASIEKVGGGFGKGYVEAMGYWRQIMDGLDALREKKNIASILIGHVSVKGFNDPTADAYDTYIFDVHKRASEALLRWADCILFANRRVAVKREETGFNKVKARATGGGDPMLYTQKRPAHPGGGRGVFGQLPYEMPLTWPAFTGAIAAASQ